MKKRFLILCVVLTSCISVDAGKKEKSQESPRVLPKSVAKPGNCFVIHVPTLITFVQDKGIEVSEKKCQQALNWPFAFDKKRWNNIRGKVTREKCYDQNWRMVCWETLWKWMKSLNRETVEIFFREFVTGSCIFCKSHWGDDFVSFPCRKHGGCLLCALKNNCLKEDGLCCSECLNNSSVITRGFSEMSYAEEIELLDAELMQCLEECRGVQGERNEQGKEAEGKSPPYKAQRPAALDIEPHAPMPSCPSRHIVTFRNGLCPKSC